MDAVRYLVMRCLPRGDVTLPRILSAAGGATALSPRWRRIWRSEPLVLYDVDLLHWHPHWDPAFPASVTRILGGHPGPFRTVHLRNGFFGIPRCEPELHLWPRLLADDGGVQDLVFISQPPPIDMPLPADILRCAKLRRLYLGFLVFPDTSDLPDGAGVFPHLREFVLLNTRIEDRDLDHMLASSPKLELLAFVVSYGLPQHFRLRGQNLKCVLFMISGAVEVAVMDAPRLERFFMFRVDSLSEDDESLMAVRITCAPALKVFGYLDAGAHQLRIGDTIIKADTKATPSSVVPSIKILALKVNLGVFSEVQMVASFLRCFPNIETLHVESAITDGPTGEHYTEFFEKLRPIECVQSRIKKVVLHEFRVDVSEAAFLKYLTQRVNQLQELTVVLSDERLVSMGQQLLSGLAIPPWATKACTVSLVGPKRDWIFHTASDLSIDDPFVSDHGQELFRFIKKGN
ncbi:hypothetical protein ACP70R_037260 [Stipagrostis hirtigluma subsp. patula]